VGNTNGNTITFFYRRDRGAAYPLWIEYTGNKGQTPAYPVDFALEERPDAEISYAIREERDAHNMITFIQNTSMV
jgi:hypothetical protein